MMEIPNSKETIREINNLFEQLFPICRSITGDGVRKSLSILKEITDFQINEIPSGTICYDWKVPNEWNISNAFVEDSNGNKIIDFQKNNLHVVNYSIPIDDILTFEELEKHLHMLKDHPDSIPYRTTYYNEDWGFCISYEQFKKMDRNSKYHVKIDSTLKPGKLTFGEYVIEGDSGKEFIFSTYCCHPSLANDNLSGLVLWILLLRKLKSIKTNHTYRFIVVPETIGAIAYLSLNEKIMKNVLGGFILTCVAGPGKFSYKQTFLGDDLIDDTVRKTFSELELDLKQYNFDITGSDEGQYSSPFFRIPIGTICKDKYHEFEYYHTSKDNLNFISANYLIETLDVYYSVIMNLENILSTDFENQLQKKLDMKKTNLKKNVIYKSLNPHCVPMLSKRGLYPTLGGKIKQKAADSSKDHFEQKYNTSNGESISGTELDAIIWMMFYSDGQMSLLEISKKIGFPLNILRDTAEKLCKNNLLEKIN
jgi:aminopeptidase-like protein|tara:strand:+ start:3429 stop:4868 length:1440 start_codon:yes stop_codon:yes gene_type:complete